MQVPPIRTLNKNYHSKKKSLGGVGRYVGKPLIKLRSRVTGVTKIPSRDTSVESSKLNSDKFPQTFDFSKTNRIDEEKVIEYIINRSN